MNTNSVYVRYWVRGLGVFLMLFIINVVLGLSAAAAGSLLSHLPSRTVLMLTYLVVMFVVGLPFMGWIFERFAVRLPRIEGRQSPSDAV